MLAPKQVLFIAISNYLTVEEAKQFKDECIKYKNVGDLKFMRTAEKHFDFNLFKNKPFIPEDILIEKKNGAKKN